LDIVSWNRVVNTATVPDTIEATSSTLNLRLFNCDFYPIVVVDLEQFVIPDDFES
jgi:hypothetical protein